MKISRLTALLFLLCIAGRSFSQTYYSDSFSTATMQAGYVLWDVDGATISPALTAYGWTNAAWMIRPLGTQTNYWAGSGSDFTSATTQADRWLCTPRFTIPAGATNVQLRWDGSLDYQSISVYEVRISTTDSLTTSFSTILAVDTEFSGSWVSHYIPLQAYAGQTVRIAFRNITNMATVNGMALYIDNISVASAAGYDMSVTTVDMYEHNWTGTGYGAQVQGYLRSYGYDSVSSFDLNYSINGAAPVTATIFPAAPIPTGAYYHYTHPILANPSIDGTYSIRVWCTNINGSHADQVPGNDTATSSSLYFYHRAANAQKAVMLEQFTGAGVPWCPGGDFALREILAAHPAIVPVCIHSSEINDLGTTPADAMAMTDGETVTTAMCLGFPNAMIDRVFTYDNQALSSGIGLYTTGSGIGSTWDTLAAWRANAPTPVNVTVSGISFDTVAQTVTATVNATFLNSLTANDFRTNLYLTEDSVITSGNGYNQDNGSYSSASTGGSVSGSAAGALYTMPTVVINDGQPNHWTHNHVLRSMAGGPWGSTGVIPAAPVAGNTYSHTYTISTNAAWRSRFLKVIAIVQEYDTNVNKRTILNVSSSPVSGATSSSTAVITIPSGASAICPGSSVLLTASSGPAYQWQLNGTSLSGATSQSLAATAAGTYTVMITYGTGNTDTSAPVTLTMDSVVANFALVADSGIAELYHTINTSYIVGGSHYEWAWGDGSTDSVASPSHLYSGAGPYQVCLSLVDIQGCTSHYCDSTNVITVPFPSSVSVSSSTSLICNGAAATLTATYCTGCSYLWSTGATTQTIQAATAGPYTVTVSEGSNSASATSGLLIVDTVVAGYTLTPDTSNAHVWLAYNTCHGNNTLFYIWSWGDNTPLDTGATVSHTFAAAGFFDICVEAIDINGCAALYCDSSTYVFKTQTAIIVQVITAGVNGIQDIAADAKVKVYPSPGSGAITIETSSGAAMTAEIQDELGRSVAAFSLTGKKTNVDLRSLSDGIYTVSFKNSTAPAVKFVIAR